MRFRIGFDFRPDQTPHVTPSRSCVPQRDTRVAATSVPPYGLRPALPPLERPFLRLGSNGPDGPGGWPFYPNLELLWLPFAITPKFCIDRGVQMLYLVSRRFFWPRTGSLIFVIVLLSRPPPRLALSLRGLPLSVDKSGPGPTLAEPFGVPLRRPPPSVETRPGTRWETALLSDRRSAPSP